MVALARIRRAWFRGQVSGRLLPENLGWRRRPRCFWPYDFL